MRRLFTAGIVVFLLAFVVFELSINGVWQTDHSTSFVQLDYSLWHDHSFALTSATKVPPWSVDDFVYRGQNYSALAPGTAFLALPFAGLGCASNGGYTAFGYVLLLSETFVALTAALASYLVYRLALLYFRRSTSVLLAFAFAFSTTVWPMATYFFQSDPSALFVVLAAYLAVRGGRTGGPAVLLSALAGVSAGVAFTVDSVNGVLLPVLFAFLLLTKRGSLRQMLESAGAMVLGVVPGFAAIGYYDYAIFGSPFTGTEQSYLHVSSVLGSFTTSPSYGAALDLFSPARGLFVYAPFLVLGVMGFWEALRKKGVRLEMLLYLSIFVGILLPYTMWYDPTGGLSYGPRFLTAAIPFMLLPAGYVVERARGWKELAIFALFLAGAVTNGMAAVVTAIPVTTSFGDSPFVSVILPDFLQGKLDTTWSGAAHPWAWGILLVAALGVVLPLAAVGLIGRRESRADSGAVQGQAAEPLLRSRRGARETVMAQGLARVPSKLKRSGR